MKPQSLNDVFNVNQPENLPEVITQSGEVIVPHLNSDNEKVEYDYNKTRDNLHSLLNQGQEALYHALEVAKQSEHPRAFEVVGELMSKLATVNGQLLDLTEKKQKLVTKKEKEGPQNITNNAIFVGSTNELKKMLNNIDRGD